MRAFVLDDAVVAVLDRSCPSHGNDRVGVHAIGDRHLDERLQERIGGVHVVQSGRNHKWSSQHTWLAELCDLNRGLGKSTRQVHKLISKLDQEIARQVTPVMWR